LKQHYTQLIKIFTIIVVSNNNVINGSKQNIEHDYDWIYDMIDLSRILRIRVLGISG